MNVFSDTLTEMFKGLFIGTVIVGAASVILYAVCLIMLRKASKTEGKSTVGPVVGLCFASFLTLGTLFMTADIFIDKLADKYAVESKDIQALISAGISVGFVLFTIGIAQFAAGKKNEQGKLPLRSKLRIIIGCILVAATFAASVIASIV